MNKSILMSIRPQYVAKILNGEKTIEIRKKFPKDYVGWVYIYCTKGKGKHWDNQIAFNIETHKYFFSENLGSHNPNDISWCGFNGKVVARFWCDKVDKLETEFYIEEPLYKEYGTYQAIKRVCLEQLELVDYDEDWCDRDTLYCNENYLNEEEEKKNKFLKECCLSGKELQKYFNRVDIGYAIHISKLEVFDKPREINEFYTKNLYKDISKMFTDEKQLDDGTWVRPIKKAPQSYMFIEDTQ